MRIIAAILIALALPWSAAASEKPSISIAWRTDGRIIVTWGALTIRDVDEQERKLNKS